MQSLIEIEIPVVEPQTQTAGAGQRIGGKLTLEDLFPSPTLSIMVLLQAKRDQGALLNNNLQGLRFVRDSHLATTRGSLRYKTLRVDGYAILEAETPTALGYFYLTTFQQIDGLERSYAFLICQKFVKWEPVSGKEMALILLRTKLGKGIDVAQALVGLPGVVETGVMTGEVDVYCKVYSDSLDDFIKQLYIPGAYKRKIVLTII